MQSNLSSPPLKADSPSLSQPSISMKLIWQTLKTYFGDGAIARSSPIRFNTHFCDLKRQQTTNENIHYGVEINEDAMPLFSAFGDTCAPPCSCEDVQELCRHIEDYIETVPTTHTGDYSLHTGKGDVSVEEACAYTMRDAMHWWIHWQGKLDGHHWKQIYGAFSTIPDDVMIPPQHLIDGSFRLLGNTLSDLLVGLRSENVHPDDIKFLEMCLWRQYVLQYLEKIDPGIRSILLSKMTLMTQFRNMTGNTHGAAVCILASRGIRSQGVEDNAVEMAAVSDALSLDMAKEVLGVLQGESTETVAGNREQLKKELRWLYVRCLESLDSYPSAPILRRYATAGWHYVFIMDRYRERLQNNIRFPISAPLWAKLDTYVKT